MSEWLNLSGEGGKAERAAVLEWWTSLKSDRGGRAELRRCAHPEDVALCAQYHRLLHRLHHRRVSREHLACVAGLLSHVKEQTQEPFARQLAGGGSSKVAPPCSEARFRRLLSCESPTDLYTPLRRAIRLVDATADVGGLARAVYHWGKYERQAWALSYYANAPKTSKEQ